MKYIATVDDQTYEIEINGEDEITLNGESLSVDFQSIAEQSVYSLILDGKSYEAYIYPTETDIEVLLRGRLYHVSVEDERQMRLRQTTEGSSIDKGELFLKAPMPGLIVAIPIEEGQDVVAGDNLVILESMKMQNELKAPRDGKVSRVRVVEGDNVDQNQVLLILE
jgi:acetyl/propionyl-CoA carboxylase alpha subunit